MMRVTSSKWNDFQFTHQPFLLLAPVLIPAVRQSA